MKKWLVILVSGLLTMAPMVAAAMEHEHAEHDHSGHEMMGHDGHADHKGHDGMSASGDVIMLGDAVVENGVEAMAHLKDVSAAMAKMGMPTTHHFMVMFKGEKNGASIDKGKVAVKIVEPDGAVSDPIRLMGMQGHFGADVTLTAKGHYLFKVGSKLADGKKRQFEFEYHNH